MRELGKTCAHCVGVLLFTISMAFADQHSAPSYSPVVNHNHPTTVYWGDA